MNLVTGDFVSHTDKPYRGVAVIKTLLDGHATLWYPKLSLTVGPVPVRKLSKEEPPK